MHSPFIRAADARDHEPIIELSLKAWEPVFRSFRTVWGPSLYERFYPDWKQSQSDDVAAALQTNPTWVAVVGDSVAGFVNVKFDDETSMGEIYMIAVAPDHQRQGLATLLTQHALAEMRSHGITLAVVSTGGDPGHAPARATYERNGFVAFPQVLYSMLLAPASDADSHSTVENSTAGRRGEPSPSVAQSAAGVSVERIDYAGIDPTVYASIRRVLSAAFDDADDETESLRDFSDFDHWFAAIEQSEIVAVTGLLFREVLVDGRPVQVAGIGGVATDSSHRNRGSASRLVDAALRFTRDRSIASFGLLQCTPDLVPFYAARGWRHMPESLVCRQSDGDTYKSPELPMLIELGSASWPTGVIDMNGLPW
ncbi:MAG: GNAT family N-acetyltransferase [Actinomycetota bacterium]|jgi:ribosomal protein S18 acetylase RimI-like enzyme